MMNRLTLLGFTAAVAIASAPGAHAQQAAALAPPAPPVAAAPTQEPGVNAVAEVVVTAQKRSERLNDVPLSITAVSGAQLTAQGITSTADLSKVVPGFTFTQSQYGPPVFTLRGIGFYDTSIGAKPAVSVYLDQVPIPFSIETTGTAFDLERVEVLKGPQGTLFGQNSTGGAINYIAAKPTKDFHAGVDLDYGRFDAFTGSGFISGPISDKVTARLAIQTLQGGAYQQSQTRPGSSDLGDRDNINGRLLIDFVPISKLRLEFGATGFINKSDTPAAQLIGINPLNPPGLSASVATAPLAPKDDRAADFTLGKTNRSDHFYQFYLRGDYDLSSDLTISSITSYSQYDPHFFVDPDGVAADTVSVLTTGRIAAVSQELRLAGKIGNDLNFIVGADYSDEHTFQTDTGSLAASSSSSQFNVLGPFGVPFFAYRDVSEQFFKSEAAFLNVDYKFLTKFTVHGGVRYTNTDIDFDGGTADPGNNTLGFDIQNLFNFAVRPGAGLPGDIVIAPGAFYTLQTDPNKPNFLSAGLVRAKLDQDNVSWRTGIDFKAAHDVLLYVNVSKGYKSGSFPSLPANDSQQYRPVTQESILAYEGGVKASFWQRRGQFNAAVFYDDYGNKQILGRVIASPNIFGPLSALVNVPKSRIAGAEASLQINPIRGLNLSVSGTYIDSKIQGSFVNTDSFGIQRDFGGESFPFTPRYEVNADGQYEWAVNEKYGAFVGSTVEYRSPTNGALGDIALLGIKQYELFDFRAGITTGEGRYRLTGYIRNAFNDFYVTNATRVNDTSVRYAGLPRTFGVQISARY